MSKDKKVEKTEMVKAEPKFNDFQSFAGSLAEEFVPVPTCKLCNSSSRVEATEKFRKGVNASLIHKWLTDEKKEEISYVAVNNHFKNHLERTQNNLNLKEYSEQLAKWSEFNSDTEALFNRYIKMFDMEVMNLMAKNPSLDAAEVRRNLETAAKIAALQSSYREQLQKMQLEKGRVELIIMSLNRIIQVKVNTTDSPEVKSVLQDVIEQLSKEVGDLSVEGEIVEN